MIFLNLIAITIIVCILIDLSGFVESVKRWVWKWVFSGKKEYKDFSFKPFDCSLCMTHHTLLLYLLFSSQFGIFNYLLVCVLSLCSSVITSFLITLKDFLIFFNNKLNDIIK